VKASERLFIVGGNVRLIAGYHALQAGIRWSGWSSAAGCGG
jgi:hypothetical protein